MLHQNSSTASKFQTSNTVAYHNLSKKDNITGKNENDSVLSPLNLTDPSNLLHLLDLTNHYQTVEGPKNII